MKIRLMGTPAECDAAAAVLVDADRLEVVEVSEQYPNRGGSALVRVYVEARLTSASADALAGREVAR